MRARLRYEFQEGVRRVNLGPKAVRKIGEYYAANADIIELNRVPTLEFASGQATKRRYTRAKVIDMIFFIAGESEE